MRAYEGQELVAAELPADAITAFECEHRFLSNYFATPVAIYGIEVPTVEHASAIAKCDPNEPTVAVLHGGGRGGRHYLDLRVAS